MTSFIEHTIGTWHARDHGGAHVEVWNDNDAYGELHSSVNLWDHKLGARDPEHPFTVEHLHDVLTAYIDGAELPRVPVAQPAVATPTNGDRAWRAWSTVCDYARRTGQITDQRFITDPSSTQGGTILLEWVGDLVADLLHLTQQHGLEADDVLERARMHYDAELEEESTDAGCPECGEDRELSHMNHNTPVCDRCCDDCRDARNVGPGFAIPMHGGISSGRFKTTELPVRIIFGADTMPEPDTLLQLVRDQLSGELSDDGLFCCDVIGITTETSPS